MGELKTPQQIFASGEPQLFSDLSLPVLSTGYITILQQFKDTSPDTLKPCSSAIAMTPYVTNLLSPQTNVTSQVKWSQHFIYPQQESKFPSVLSILGSWGKSKCQALHAMNETHPYTTAHGGLRNKNEWLFQQGYGGHQVYQVLFHQLQRSSMNKESNT